MSNQSSNVPEGLSQRVATAEDFEALRNLKARYATLADRCLTTPSHENAVALADLFTDDAVGDYGFFGRFQGRADLVRAFESVLPAGMRWSMHYITNPELSVDGSHAKGAWYFLVSAVTKDAPPGAMASFYGLYEDVYVKTATGWKFASLVVHFNTPPQ
ncbi:MAG: nuclear transport factor 2 family protein [Minicystis sp.]